MSKIIQSFYGPLHTLFCCLVSCFPEDEGLHNNIQVLREAIEKSSDTLFLHLATGITTDLKNAFVAREAELFFQGEATNVFLQFIGGRRIYDCLDEAECLEYWGETLNQTLRQGLLLKAIAPKLSSINSIVDSLIQTQTDNEKPTIQGTVEKMLSSEDLLNNVLNLVKHENGVKDLMTMMKGVMGSLTDENTEVVSEPHVENNPLRQLEEEFGELNIENAASTVFRKARDNKKPQNLQNICSMLENIQGDMNIDDLQKDLTNSIDTGEIKGLVGGLLETIGDGGKGDVQSMLHSVMSMV